MGVEFVTNRNLSSQFIKIRNQKHGANTDSRASATRLVLSTSTSKHDEINDVFFPIAQSPPRPTVQLLDLT